MPGWMRLLPGEARTSNSSGEQEVAAQAAQDSAALAQQAVEDVKGPARQGAAFAEVARGEEPRLKKSWSGSNGH